VRSTISPLPLPQRGRGRGPGGKVRGHPHCGAPSPPAPLPHCGRGVCKRGIGDRRRIAPAPLVPPSSPLVEEKGGQGGKVRGHPHCGHPHPQPLSRTAGEGCVNAVSVTGAGSPLLRSSPPSSPAAWERTGARGEGEGMNDLAKLYRIFNLRSQSFAIVKISTEDWLT